VLLINTLYNPASSDHVYYSLDFTRHIPVPRPSGIAMQRAIWLSCQIVESSPFGQLRHLSRRIKF